MGMWLRCPQLRSRNAFPQQPRGPPKGPPPTELRLQLPHPPVQRPQGRRRRRQQVNLAVGLGPVVLPSAFLVGEGTGQRRAKWGQGIEKEAQPPPAVSLAHHVTQGPPACACPSCAPGTHGSACITRTRARAGCTAYIQGGCQVLEGSTDAVGPAGFRRLVPFPGAGGVAAAAGALPSAIVPGRRRVFTSIGRRIWYGVAGARGREGGGERTGGDAQPRCPHDTYELLPVPSPLCESRSSCKARGEGPRESHRSPASQQVTGPRHWRPTVSHARSNKPL